MHKSVIVAILFACAITVGCIQEEREGITENVRVIEPWSLKLIERQHGPEESDAILIDLYTEKGGKRYRLATNLVGPFLPLLRAKRIFSCESNMVMNTDAPVLMDLNGTKTHLPEHPGFLRSCTTVGTGEELLLQYNLVEGRAPYNLVRILDSSGHVLVERRLNTEGDIEFMVSERMYKAHIPSPDYPG